MMRISKTFIIFSLLSLLALISVSLLWRNPFFLTSILIIIGIVMIAIGKSRTEDIYLYVTVSFLGALSEALGVYFVAWTYSLPEIIGIPIWLPFLWGVAGLVIKRISLKIHNLKS
jgi:hypothetical protein